MQARIQQVGDQLTLPIHPRLDDLLRGVTDENRHGETETGPAVGSELLPLLTDDDAIA